MRPRAGAGPNASRAGAGLENADQLTAIDTLTNKAIASVAIGQVPQAVTYVPNVVPDGDGTQGLQPLETAGEAIHLTLVSASTGLPAGGKAATSVLLFDQGFVQVLQVAVTGLEPNSPYVLAFSREADGGRSGASVRV